MKAEVRPTTTATQAFRYALLYLVLQPLHSPFPSQLQESSTPLQKALMKSTTAIATMKANAPTTIETTFTSNIFSRDLPSGVGTGPSFPEVPLFAGSGMMLFPSFSEPSGVGITLRWK